VTRFEDTLREREPTTGASVSQKVHLRVVERDAIVDALTWLRSYRRRWATTHSAPTAWEIDALLARLDAGVSE
jgi:hypothetical protein